MNQVIERKFSLQQTSIEEDNKVEIIKLGKNYTIITNDVNDEELKKNLFYYNFLNNNIEKLALKEDKNKISYSKYYWYIEYKRRYFELFGYDAGIEQEGFKLLEEIENELEDRVDWSRIQKIEEKQK